MRKKKILSVLLATAMMSAMLLAAAAVAALLCCGCSGQEPLSEKTAGEEEACRITDLSSELYAKSHRD